MKNEPKNKAVEHVIQPHPDLFQEQADTQLELLIGGYTDADEDAAKQVAYEASAQDINEPNKGAYDEESDKADRTGRKDGRAREEQGRADGGWPEAMDEQTMDMQMMDGRERAGQRRWLGPLVRPSWNKVPAEADTILGHGACRG